MPLNTGKKSWYRPESYQKETCAEIMFKHKMFHSEFLCCRISIVTDSFAGAWYKDFLSSAEITEKVKKRKPKIL